MATELTPEQITQALIDEAKREMAEEEARIAKERIKAMLSLISQKEQAAANLTKQAEVLKDQMKKGDYSAVSRCNCTSYALSDMTVPLGTVLCM